MAVSAFGGCGLSATPSLINNKTTWLLSSLRTLTNGVLAIDPTYHTPRCRIIYNAAQRTKDYNEDQSSVAYQYYQPIFGWLHAEEQGAIARTGRTIVTKNARVRIARTYTNRRSVPGVNLYTYGYQQSPSFSRPRHQRSLVDISNCLSGLLLSGTHNTTMRRIVTGSTTGSGGSNREGQLTNEIVPPVLGWRLGPRWRATISMTTTVRHYRDRWLTDCSGSTN